MVRLMSISVIVGNVSPSVPSRRGYGTGYVFKCQEGRAHCRRRLGRINRTLIEFSFDIDSPIRPFWGFEDNCIGTIIDMWEEPGVAVAVACTTMRSASLRLSHPFVSSEKGGSYGYRNHSKPNALCCPDHVSLSVSSVDDGAFGDDRRF